MPVPTGIVASHKSVVGGGPAPIIDQTFDGTAGTLITTKGYASDGWGPVAVLDGAGNAKGINSGGSTWGSGIHQTALPNNCWSEVVFSIADITQNYNVYTGVRFSANGAQWGMEIHAQKNDNSTIYLQLLEGGYPTGVNTTAPITAGVDHTLRIEMNGNSYKGFLDGVEKLTFTDTSPSPMGNYCSIMVNDEFGADTQIVIRSHKAGAL